LLEKYQKVTIFAPNLKKMKKLILLTIVAAGFIACNSNKTETVEVSPMTTLEAWLDSIDGLGDVSAEQMTAIQAEYDAATAGMDASTMDDAQKSEWDAIASRWETFKANNAADESTEGEGEEGTATPVSEEHAKEIYTEFLGDVQMADANDYTFMTADNALATYEGFAAKAKMHKDDYSSDDWNFVKAMYEKIDARKNEVEKDLKSADNLKIAKIKLKLAPMFKLGKIGAKIDEKVEQKEAE